MWRTSALIVGLKLGSPFSVFGGGAALHILTATAANIDTQTLSFCRH